MKLGGDALLLSRSPKSRMEIKSIREGKFSYLRLFVKIQF